MPIATIKEQLKNIPKNSGVYQFISKDGEILYIGKAKNLKNRITSYTRKNQLSDRIGRMVYLAVKVEYTQTQSELEALLLEHNLIKKISPKFNILLKDDKTFPQILITNHPFPQITKYRGIKNDQGFYFGPFASAHDVNRVIDILRKAFQLRSCSDSDFKSRRKPCLDYQIKKCSAPCVRVVNEDEYAIQTSSAIDFLSGKSESIQDELKTKMLIASKKMEYEKAAQIRDQINSLNSIQAKQNINLTQGKDFDIFNIIQINNKICVYVSFYRCGQNYGSKPYFFESFKGQTLKYFLSEFLGQFYLKQKAPKLILTNIEIEEQDLMSEFISCQNNYKISIINPKKGDKYQLLSDHYQIGKEVLERRVSNNLSTKSLLKEVKELFNLKKIPQRIEVYDNSHLAGTNAVGALITANQDGFDKSGYRKFNIGKIEQEHSDDTAMLREVLLRRFARFDQDQKSSKPIKSTTYPDFIIIDGGKGQLSSAIKVFKEIKVDIPFICMSKGENRNAGEEWFHMDGHKSFTIDKNSPVMYYLQRLRDEAHRYAIGSHRKKRSITMLN